MKLTGNTIFITGGASGIGRGFAEEFHRRGNQVIIAGRRQSLLDEVTAANPGMTGIALDITDPEDVARIAAKLVAEHPTLNVIFNNAVLMPFDNPAETIDDAVAQTIVTTNLLGPIRLTSALIEHLKAQPDATILYNTSVLAYVPLAGNAVYSATKAALHSYALSQRFMLRDTSVRVQEIAPPWVNTDLVKKSDDERAMPIDTFIAEMFVKLGSDDPEIFTDGVRSMRANPGIDEHALVDGFNAAMIANPIPV